MDLEVLFSLLCESDCWNIGCEKKKKGEALSSMCAVADVVITTKTQKDPVAIEYTMNIDGSIQRFFFFPKN